MSETYKGASFARQKTVLLSTVLMCALAFSTTSYADYSNISSKNLTKTEKLDTVRAERILCIREDQQGWKVGTATVMNDRTILTAHHVVKGCSVVYIGKKSYKIAHTDASIDLAVLGKGRDFRQLNCQGLKKGKHVSLTGYPEGSKQKVVSQGKTLKDKKSKYAAVEGFAMKGMSGGPVVQDNAQLAGIFKAFRGTSRYWYVPGPKICNSLKALKGARLNDGTFSAPEKPRYELEPVLVAENTGTPKMQILPVQQNAPPQNSLKDKSIAKEDVVQKTVPKVPVVTQHTEELKNVPQVVVMQGRTVQRTAVKLVQHPVLAAPKYPPNNTKTASVLSESASEALTAVVALNESVAPRKKPIQKATKPKLDAQTQNTGLIKMTLFGTSENTRIASFGQEIKLTIPKMELTEKQIKLANMGQSYALPASSVQASVISRSPSMSVTSPQPMSLGHWLQLGLAVLFGFTFGGSFMLWGGRLQRMLEKNG